MPSMIMALADHNFTTFRARCREDHSQSVLSDPIDTPSAIPLPMVPRRALPLGAARSLGRLVSRKAPLLFDQLAREDALVSSGWTDRTGKSIDADTITGSWRRAPPARE